MTQNLKLVLIGGETLCFRHLFVIIHNKGLRYGSSRTLSKQEQAVHGGKVIEKLLNGVYTVLVVNTSTHYHNYNNLSELVQEETIMSCQHN